MLYAIFYLFIVLIEIVFAIFSAGYMILLFYSSLKGSPYVPTKDKAMKNIFEEAGLKKGQVMYDIGCGDGRVVRYAVKQYGVRGIGIDINPMLIFFARLKARMMKLKGAEFRVQNIFDVDLSDADVIYIFLLPQFLVKIQKKLERGTKKGAVIISHGFKMDAWSAYNYKTIKAKPFPTYFYKIQ